MVDRALIAGDESGGDGPKELKNEYLGTDTQRTADGVICRGKESDDRFLAELFLQKHPSLRGVLREDQAIQAAKDENLKGASHSADETPNEPDWWQKNAQMVRAIVRVMKMNGDNDDRTYQRVNSAANKHVGIPKVDELVAPATMKKRHAFLKSWFDAVRNDQEFNHGY